MTRRKAEPLTDAEYDTMCFIARFLRQRGYAPSLKEIGAASGVGINAAHSRVRALVRKGVLERPHGAHRMMRLLCTLDEVQRV